MHGRTFRRLRLPLLLALGASVAYAMAPSLGLARGPGWTAALVAAMSVLGVAIVRVFVLDVAFRRLVGHPAPALVHVVVSLILYFAVALVIAGGVFDLSVGSALATSAVASLVLGLALQETLGNLSAGVALQIERPFRPGDVVLSNGLEGRVVAFDWRTTTILTVEDTRIAIPNAAVARGPLHVFAHDRLNRRSVRVPAPYGGNPQRVIRLAAEAAAGIDGISDERPPEARVASFDGGSVGYDVLYWLRDVRKTEAVNAAIRQRVWYAFSREGLAFPFNQVQLFSDPLEVAAGDGAAELPDPSDDAPWGGRDGVLDGVALFAPLAADERRTLARLARTRVFGPGERVIRHGGDGGSMFVVRRGHVEVCAQLPGGRPLRVAGLGPGEVLGEMSLLTGEPRSADVWAVDEVELLEVGKEAMAGVLARNPLLAEVLSHTLSERLGQRSDVLGRSPTAAPTPARPDSLLRRIQHFFDI